MRCRAIEAVRYFVLEGSGVDNRESRRRRRASRHRSAARRHSGRPCIIPSHIYTSALCTGNEEDEAEERKEEEEDERVPWLIASRLRLNLSPGCNALAHAGTSGFNKRLLATKLLVGRTGAAREEVLECRRATASAGDAATSTAYSSCRFNRCFCFRTAKRHY